MRLSNLIQLLNRVVGEKRIERRHTPIVLAVIQVFSVNSLTAEFSSRGYYCGIPIAQLKALLDLQRK